MVDRASWQVAGKAPEVYERDLVPAVFGPWARVVVDFADLESGDRVLDVACPSRRVITFQPALEFGVI